MASEMHICSHETWMSHYATFKPEDPHVEACMLLLEEHGVLMKHKEDGYYVWRNFPRPPNKLRKQTATNLSVNTQGPAAHHEPPNLPGAHSTADMDVDGATPSVVDPAVHRTEPQIFSGLGVISESIGQYKYEDPKNPANNRKVTCQYGEQPSQTFQFEKDGGNHKVDGFWELLVALSNLKNDSRRHDADITCTASYKLWTSSGDIQNNRLQALGAAVATMNNDPIRTHTYSLTIENGQVSAWYWCRSHATRSAPFPFAGKKVTKCNIKRFIATIMSFMFGRREELGYDPCIHRKRDEETQKIYYIFELQGRFYRSLRTLFEADNLRISSRATRVWEVIEIVSIDNPTPVVGALPKALKDAWIAEGARFEREIQEHIFKDLQALVDIYALPPGEPADDPPSGTRMDRDRFFREPPEELKGATNAVLAYVFDCLNHGRYKDFFVLISDDRKDGPKTRPLPDEASVSREPDVFIPPPRQRQGEIAMPGSRPETSRPASFQPSTPTDREAAVKPYAAPREYRVKTRYFILLDTVGAALREVPVFEEVFIVMKDGFTALWLISLVGWIHRDISDGNIIKYTKDGDSSIGGKLADFEYAIKPADRRYTAADPKTGTPFYMAVEIHDGVPLFHTYDEERDTLTDAGELVTVNRSSDAEPCGVPHKFPHDIESFFWLVLHFLIARVEYSPSLTWANGIFVADRICPAKKRVLFNNPGLFRQDFVKSGHSSFQGLRLYLNVLRLDLLQAYNPNMAKIHHWRIFMGAKVLLEKAHVTCSEPDVLPLLVWQPAPTKSKKSKKGLLSLPPVDGAAMTGSSESTSRKRKSIGGLFSASTLSKAPRASRVQDVSSQRSSSSHRGPGSTSDSVASGSGA